MSFIISQLVTQRGHLPPQTQLAINDPIMDLLVRVMKGVLCRVQGRRVQLISISISVLAMTLGANTQEDLAPLSNWIRRR